jgi:hypothetical protein
MLPTGRINYSRISHRAPLKLPNSTRMAVWVIVFVEHSSSLVLSHRRSSGDIEERCDKGGARRLFSSGEISEGDAETVKASIKAANEAGKLVSELRLNFPGGNVLEALSSRTQCNLLRCPH